MIQKYPPFCLKGVPPLDDGVQSTSGQPPQDALSYPIASMYFILCYIYTYIYLQHQKSTIHVGKIYNRHMDGFGFGNSLLLHMDESPRST